MKLRKLLSITLALLMVAGLIPALLAPASAATATQPSTLPGLGSDFYVESVSAATETALSTSSYTQIATKPASGTADNWYNASGVMFQIKATDGSWLTDTTATLDPYMFFSIAAVGQQKVTQYKSDGSTTTNYATFWTTDYFHGRKNNTYNPKVVSETSTMYFSDDDGKTWNSITNAETLSHKFYGFNLAGLNPENVWIYIPMEEFFYYGGWGGSGEGHGVTGYYSGFTTFQEGVQIIKDAGNTALHSLQLSYRTSASISSGTVGAQSDVTASDIRLVYDIVDEVKISDDATSADLYVNRPNLVSDAVVTATLDGSAAATLTGTEQADGRTKYSLTGLTTADLGKKVTFTYTSAASAISKTATVTVKTPVADADLETMPSTLSTTQKAMGSSNLYKRSAVFAGDSLIYAARDTDTAGWSGRLATTYSMSNNKIGIGGKTLSAWTTNTNSGAIYTQISGQVSAANQYANDQVDYVILDGGINDVNRDGSTLGAVSANTMYGFDTGTIIGALEHTFAETKRVYPNATIGFIILFRMPLAMSSSQPDGLPCRDMTMMQEYVDAVKATCEKWGVHYLNMFEDVGFNELIDVANASSAYLDNADMLHLNAAGYELTAPYIAAWMESLPLAEGSTATVYENQPTELPGGDGYYGDLFRATPSSGTNNFNNESAGFNDWYKAEGVMFEIDATTAGMWHASADAVANDVYWCFDLALYTRQKVYGYTETGSQTNSYGVFWTNDNFYGEEQTGSLAGATSLLYYSEDAGKTWNTATTGTSTSREGVGIYALNLTDVNTENVWIYIPMTEFYYYGAYESGALALGLNSYHKGFETLENGITALEEAKAANVGSTAYGTTARNFMFTSSTPSTVTLDGTQLSDAATAGVTISNVQFVYDVIDTASVTVENDLSMSIYTAEPEKAEGLGNVSATMNGKTVKLTGEEQADGRMKYTFKGILPQQIGDEIEFFWQTGKTGIGQKVTLSVQKYAETVLASATDENLKTLLNAMLHYGAEAQKYVGYKTASLCNANASAVTDVTISELTAPYVASDGNFTGASLLLDGTMTFKIAVADTVTAVTYECAGNTGTLEIVDGYAYFNVYAHRAAEAITLTAEGADTSCAFSLNWYLQGVTSDAELALIQAIANYTSAAAAYVTAN